MIHFYKDCGMNCLKCGNEIPDDSVVCGSKVKEPSKRRSTGLIVVIAVLIGLFIWFGYWHEYRLSGIVINSPDEITDEFFLYVFDLFNCIRNISML